MNTQEIEWLDLSEIRQKVYECDDLFIAVVSDTDRFGNRKISDLKVCRFNKSWGQMCQVVGSIDLDDIDDKLCENQEKSHYKGTPTLDGESFEISGVELSWLDWMQILEQATPVDRKGHSDRIWSYNDSDRIDDDWYWIMD